MVFVGFFNNFTKKSKKMNFIKYKILNFQKKEKIVKQQSAVLLFVLKKKQKN